MIESIAPGFERLAVPLNEIGRERLIAEFYKASHIGEIRPEVKSSLRPHIQRGRDGFPAKSFIASDDSIDAIFEQGLPYLETIHIA